MPLAPVPVFDPPQSLWTADQFLDWLEPGIHADLIDGEVCMHSPVNLRHARLVNFVERLLGAFVEHHGLGEVHREVVAVRLGSRHTFLPDVAFWTTAQTAAFQPTHVPVAPTLVIEALSPTTAELDLGPKFSAYEEHGVGEYWILDPDQSNHRFYRREGDYLTEFAERATTIPSATITGFDVRRDWLDPDNLPTVAECLSALLDS